MSQEVMDMEYRITEANQKLWHRTGLNVNPGDVFDIEFYDTCNEELIVASIDWDGDGIITWTAEQEEDICRQAMEGDKE